jgi:glycerol-3-phosphate dehydrogenase (NAD(P)+)
MAPAGAPDGRPERIAVVGAGSWGTAVAVHLGRTHAGVSLWAHEPEVVAQLRERRENGLFLPGVGLPPTVEPTGDLAEAVSGKTIVAFAVPSGHLRDVASRSAPHLADGCCAVSLAKGLEGGSLRRMTQVLEEVLPHGVLGPATLSGPTFAREVGEGKPTGATVAALDISVARRLQAAFSGSRFRVYADTDVVGIEVGGALKNVMAIAAGMCDGLGFGHNARALLVSRGLAEITRVGVYLGAHPQTFMGLGGLGDLVLTCTGDLSRNRTVGMRLGRGESIGDILSGMKMVAEGIDTAKAAFDLSRRTGVPMPISEQVYRILHEGRDVREAVSELFSRDLKLEKG